MPIVLPLRTLPVVIENLTEDLPCTNRAAPAHITEYLSLTVLIMYGDGRRSETYVFLLLKLSDLVCNDSFESRLRFRDFVKKADAGLWILVTNVLD